MLVKFKLLLAVSYREYKLEVHLQSYLNTDKWIMLDFRHGTCSTIYPESLPGTETRSPIKTESMKRVSCYDKK